MNTCKDTLFDRVTDFAQNNEYFIQSLDKQAGFIQVQKIIIEKKLLKADKRRTLNFIIRPVNENLSQISLSIRCEGLHYSPLDRLNFNRSNTCFH